jgi:hypothetical protein
MCSIPKTRAGSYRGLFQLSFGRALRCDALGEHAWSSVHGGAIIGPAIDPSLSDAVNIVELVGGSELTRLIRLNGSDGRDRMRDFCGLNAAEAQQSLCHSPQPFWTGE